MKPSTAKVYALLKVRGPDGVSPREAARWAGCDRLAARIHDLKAEGHEFTHRDEPNGNGGQHRRYFLVEPRPVPTRGVQETFADWAPGELQEAYGR